MVFDVGVVVGVVEVVGGCGLVLVRVCCCVRRLCLCSARGLSRLFWLLVWLVAGAAV